MNKFGNFIIQHEKPLKYSLVVIGFSLIIIGISFHFLKEWLVALGNSSVADGNCCICKVYITTYSTPLIVLGSFLSFPLLLENQIIKLYERCATEPNTIFVIWLILIFITLGLISYVAFHNFPYCYDEYNYLYQAKIFSHGKLFIEVPEKFRPFTELFMILRDNKLFSKYPPGFPLILTIGVLLKITGLINPLIAILTLTILYFFTKSFLGPKYGLLSIVIVSITPYFLGYSASYFSQATALMLTALIFLSVRRYELTSNVNYLFFLGLVSGYSFLTRPLDSFCAIVPSYLYLIYILYKKENIKRVGYSILTFVMIFALYLAYNYILTGKITIAVYKVFKSEFRVIHPNADGFNQNVLKIATGYIHNGIKYIPKLFFEHLFRQTGVFIPLFAIAGFFFFKSKWKWVLISNFLMLIIFYNFSRGLGWPQYGSRYYYSGFVSLAILATISFKHLIEKLKNKSHVMYLLTFVFCINIVLSFKLFNDYSFRIKTKLALIEDIASHCPDNSIVILDMHHNDPAKSHCARRHIDGLDLGSEKRNMFMNTSRLMVYADDPHFNLEKIRSIFPNRSICYYNYNILNELLSYDITPQ